MKVYELTALLQLCESTKNVYINGNPVEDITIEEVKDVTNYDNNRVAIWI